MEEEWVGRVEMEVEGVEWDGSCFYGRTGGGAGGCVTPLPQEVMEEESSCCCEEGAQTLMSLCCDFTEGSLKYDHGLLLQHGLVPVRGGVQFILQTLAHPCPCTTGCRLHICSCLFVVHRFK